MKDRFGFGWRPELAAGILTHLEKIDIVEVIADDYFAAPRKIRRALTTLAKQVPVALHGVTLGLASAVPVERQRLERTAKLIDEVQPEFWSEHLAFVRGGSIEIGHLAAPPRTAATIAGAAGNLAMAKSITGAAPMVENIATLIDPPGSALSEVDWTVEVLAAANCPMLLDLHNLYANSANFGFDAYDYIDRLPQERIHAIHLAGGRWITAKSTHERRLLDDHLHDVPDEGYALLAHVGRRADHELTVILERDGRYPPIEVLLTQLNRARHVLALARNEITTEAA
ncbi:MAG: DUF692 domain-containing protein [Deltaproteobacteria bacterium]|nr:DUF692 domain-containing protein [Deltaproteobacteria bacterium]